MSDSNVKIDRRTFLKTLAMAGATTVFVSTVTTETIHAQGPVPQGPVPELVANLTGSAYNKSVALATAGPGKNLQWQPGDSIKFMPPTKINDGKYGDVFAALPKAKLLTTYQRMVTSRKWETTMKDVWLAGKDDLYGAFHPYVGEEAIANGAMAALNDDDFITSTHRGHGHLIARGADLNKMSAEIFARQTGYNQAFGLSMHITDRSKSILGMNGIVGGGLLMGAGAAYGTKILGTKQVVVTFMGDGAGNSRYFMNAVRNSVAFNFPYIVIIENNFQNVGTPEAKISGTYYPAP